MYHASLLDTKCIMRGKYLLVANFTIPLTFSLPINILGYVMWNGYAKFSLLAHCSGDGLTTEKWKL